MNQKLILIIFLCTFTIVCQKGNIQCSVSENDKTALKNASNGTKATKRFYGIIWQQKSFINQFFDLDFAACS